MLPSRYLCMIHPDISASSIQISQPALSRYLSSLHHHFVELNKMVAMEKVIDKCDYSCKPSWLLASPISTIRIAHFDYSCKPSRLLALVNDTKKALDASRTEG